MKKNPSALYELANQDNLAFHLSEYFRLTPKFKRNSSGIDNLSLEKIGKRNTDFVTDLSQKLKNIKKQNKSSYKHDPLIIFPIEKPQSDKFRIISIPTIKDRLVQKALLRLLEQKGIVFDTPISYGMNAEKSVQKAVKNSLNLRTKHPWVYKTDISSFFDRVDRIQIKKLVQKKIRYRSLHALIFQTIDADIKENLTIAEEKILESNGIERGTGLRQGLPLSPMLANLFLQEFDESVIENGFKAIRYVDDLIFFCNSKEECLEAHKFCVNNLKKIKLDVPSLESKTKSFIYKPEEDADFLGLVIVKKDDKYSLLISEAQISRTYEKFNSFSDLNNNLEQGIQFSKLSSKLEIIVSSYKGHYSEAENYEWFEKRLKKWRTSVYKKLISSSFNVDVENLNFNTKMFFHLLQDTKLTKTGKK